MSLQINVFYPYRLGEVNTVETVRVSTNRVSHEIYVQYAKHS